MAASNEDFIAWILDLLVMTIMPTKSAAVRPSSNIKNESQIYLMDMYGVSPRATPRIKFSSRLLQG